MPQFPKLKTTVTLSIDANVWFMYREACGNHALIPSREVEEFMRVRSAMLLSLPSPPKETDHA